MWRLLQGLAVILGLTAGMIGAVLWWDDRPLREIERALERRDFELALRLANDCLAEFPESTQAIDQKARALTGMQRWSEAERLFERVGAQSAASQRAWSQCLLHDARWSEALPLLTRLDELSPLDSDVLHELAACQAKLGFFEESIRAAERLMRLPGQESRGRLLLGMLHFQRNNNRLAIQTWLPILVENPEAANLQLAPAEFFEALGRALLDDGQAAEARRHLEQAVRLGPTIAGRNALAEACEQLGDLPQAVLLWRQIVTLQPGDRPAREGLARTALEKKADDEAREWLQPLLKRDDLKSSTAYLMQRASLMKQDKAAAAMWDERVQRLRKRETKMNALEQSLRDAPNSFWSRALRAHQFAREGNTYQALLLTQELLALKPDQPFVQQLSDALRNQKPLPSLDLIPYDQF